MLTRDKQGRFTSKVAPKAKRAKPTPAAPIAPKTKTNINIVTILRDVSSSMAHMAKTLDNSTRDYAAEIIKSSADNKLSSYITIIDFADKHDVRLEQHYAVSMPNIPTANCNGMTALYDAIDTALRVAARNETELSKRNPDADIAHLVMIMTDGQENVSRLANAKSIQSLLIDKGDKGNWTITFTGPADTAAQLAKLGLEVGNIQVWAGTEATIAHTMSVNTKGIGSYLHARSQGVKSTAAFYVNPADLKVKDLTPLTKSSDSFKVVEVDQRTAIKDFCEKKLGSFNLGNAYYELVKKEKVQAQKDIAIKDKNGRIFNGAQARALLKIPLGQEVKVTPGKMGEYTCFVQSTSVNRILEPKSFILYKS